MGNVRNRGWKSVRNVLTPEEDEKKEKEEGRIKKSSAFNQ